MCYVPEAGLALWTSRMTLDYAVDVTSAMTKKLVEVRASRNPRPHASAKMQNYSHYYPLGASLKTTCLKRLVAQKRLCQRMEKMKEN